MAVLRLNGFSLNLELLEELEERLVAANPRGDGGKLIVVPVFVIDILDIGPAHAYRQPVDVGTLSAHKNAVVNAGMGALLDVAVHAKFIEGVRF